MKNNDARATCNYNEQVEAIVARHGEHFEGFDIDEIKFVDQDGKSNKDIVKIFPTRFPATLWNDWAYTLVVHTMNWKKLSDIQRNLVMFNTLCSIPSGGCDKESNNYGKLDKPKYGYTHEYTHILADKQFDWMEIDSDLSEAKDPIESFTIPQSYFEAQEEMESESIPNNTDADLPVMENVNGCVVPVHQ